MITALLLLILVSLWVGFYQLVKQQGRILLRLDQLEQHGPAAQPGLQETSQQAEPKGLPLQSDFPPFGYPNLEGKTVALGDFRGRRGGFFKSRGKTS